MRIVTSFFILLVLFAGCSSQKEFIKAPANISECRNEVKVKPGEYLGETVEKLNLSQSDKTVTVSFEMRTLCTSKVDYDFQKTGNMIKIKLKNADTQTTDCVCLKDVAIKLDDALEPGDYTFLITNETGYQILAQQSGFLVK